ncbi:unnamed protein product [Paramecium sonneborni]|uniref:Uncharacterized protein n=1 Tax=Paramecium sonneborni TaxID=65129 RepID=A0A8S1K0T5_9CILI|nr:unnamed protein product [Paramecium sonneborni]
MKNINKTFFLIIQQLFNRIFFIVIYVILFGKKNIISSYKKLIIVLKYYKWILLKIIQSLKVIIISILQVVLTGDTKVGKTNILYKFTKNSLPKQSIPTIGVEFCTKFITSSDNQQVKLQIWDTAGQDRYKSIIISHFRRSSGAIIVYDITQEKTFQSVINWLKDIRDQTDKDVVIMLVGNKKDIVDQKEDERKISYGYASDFAQQNGLLFEEISAYTGENIEKIFNILAQAIIKRKIPEQQQKLDCAKEKQQIE